jgi:hypothetical protein
VSDSVYRNIWEGTYLDIYDCHLFAAFDRDLLNRAAKKFDAASAVVDAGGGTGDLARRLREGGPDVVFDDSYAGEIAE